MYEREDKIKYIFFPLGEVAVVLLEQYYIPNDHFMPNNSFLFIKVILKTY